MKMDLRSRIRLVDWLRTNKEYIELHGCKTIADTASQNLNFEVSEHNIRNTAKSLGLKTGVEKRSKIGEGISTIAKVRDSVLAAGLLQIAQALDVKLPDQDAIKLIAKGSSTKEIRDCLNGRF